MIMENQYFYFYENFENKNQINNVHYCINQFTALFTITENLAKSLQHVSILCKKTT